MAEHEYKLKPDDGWHIVPGEPNYHYFLRGKSICPKYPTKPSNATQDNDPSKYCGDCSRNVMDEIAKVK